MPNEKPKKHVEKAWAIYNKNRKYYWSSVFGGIVLLATKTDATLFLRERGINGNGKVVRVEIREL